MSNLDEVNAAINEVFTRVVEGSPELQSLFSPTDPKLKFPGPQGFRWHYFRLDVGKRYYMYCYSTVRNANGKFLSWVYKPYYKTVRNEKGKYEKVQAWKYESTRETRRYKSAKDRAYKKSESHKRKIADSAKRRAK